MIKEIIKVFVEKKIGFDIEAQNLLMDLKENLNMFTLKSVRIVNLYCIENATMEEIQEMKFSVLAEPNADTIYLDSFPMGKDEIAVAIESLPGQYDQRADSAVQCIEIINSGETKKVKTAKVIILKGEISKADIKRVEEYCVNPIEARVIDLDMISFYDNSQDCERKVEIVKGFIQAEDKDMHIFINSYGLVMGVEDLIVCREYFAQEEKRNPTITELRVLDTYWSDHCRHKTFLTELKEIEIDDGKFSEPIKTAYKKYLECRNEIYYAGKRPITLMDIAVLGMKALRKEGRLQQLDVSEEINACSINVKVNVEGSLEDYLVMFKNETHNHPTEIEPFGGAATCLGGAIRDPLSGRSYVYQAMRVSGSGDPRSELSETLSGKLPQRKIAIGSAHGYSSYGNQIGVATGQVVEVYDENFIAKHMELGAVIGAAPKKNIIRQTPVEGDLIILIGGRTGRDGIGGAAGSSREHDDNSLASCGAEVQKGNALNERKLQRFFRNSQVTRMIKKCNDFGAGGAAVAIGELAPGLEIYLDEIPKKYDDLDGTEIAISESQERMAVVIENKYLNKFLSLAEEENLEATVVGKVTSDERLKMQWKETNIVDIKRSFLDSNGASYSANVKVSKPSQESFFKSIEQQRNTESVKEVWIKIMSDLNVCSQKGLSERFDSTIGGGTVLMPLGGRHQSSPQEGMASKIPVLQGETDTSTCMAYGYNPLIGKWSPFHGAVFSVIEAVTKLVAMGANYSDITLSLQEYFGRLEKEPEKWGKPFSALIGAFSVQRELGIAAIGGKDSMSGTFKDMDVPPTLVTFGVAALEAERIVSTELKEVNTEIIMIPCSLGENCMPDFEKLTANFKAVNSMIEAGVVNAAMSVRYGGAAETLAKMCFGNRLGIKLNDEVSEKILFSPAYGTILLEIKKDARYKEFTNHIEYISLGETHQQPWILYKDSKIALDELLKAWTEPLEKVFPTSRKELQTPIKESVCDKKLQRSTSFGTAKPKVFIPVFPGTNCEYDTMKAFEKAGAETEIMVFKNLNRSQIQQSIDQMAKLISQSQIIMLPGGFSAGDEPDGSGKFIAAIFRNPKVKEAVMEHLKQRDGLMLGICNGFQALIKLGLLPYGEIRELDENSPTLTFNGLGRHVSRMVQTKITSNLSPWLSLTKAGEIHTVPVSHGEGRFVGYEELIKSLFDNGQVAAQYVDLLGKPTYKTDFNPNGSMHAIEAITSSDGRILGKMAHSERIGKHVCKNVPGNKNQRIFEAGVNYFK